MTFCVGYVKFKVLELSKIEYSTRDTPRGGLLIILQDNTPSCSLQEQLYFFFSFFIVFTKTIYPRRARSALGVDTVLTLDVCLYVCMLVLYKENA